MTDIVYTISKYLILFCFIIFTFTSFRAQRDVPDELKSNTFRIQKVLIIAIHAIAYFDISLHILNGTADINIWSLLGFYAGQLVYILFMTAFIPRLIRLNPGLNNVMCMFLAVGFIVQTRLGFSNSLKQFYIVLAGTVVFIFFCVFCKHARFLKNLTWIYCAAGMGLLLLVLVLSTVSRGAKLSLDIGNLFSFQPLEFVKILFVLFTAGAFYKATTFKYVIITAVCAGIHILIQVFCKDLGSAFILFIIYLMMTYIATHKFRYVVLGTLAFSAACFVAFKLFDHIQVRVGAWLDPWTDIERNGYQIAQSLFAIGTGGWFGSGLYKGSPNLIPIVSKDMVISAISEEFGAIFAIFLILLCLCFTLMIFRVAMRIESLFYKLTAFGLGVSYAIQVFLTIGGAFKFIPLTGVTLPFISSGGSSIIASMIMIGIVQALYVISESDVAHERKMVAQGADISEFAGYEDLADDNEGYEEDYNSPYYDDSYHEDVYRDGTYRETHYDHNRRVYHHYEDYDEYDEEYSDDEYSEDGDYVEEYYADEEYYDDYPEDDEGLYYDDQYSNEGFRTERNYGYSEEYLYDRPVNKKRNVRHIDPDEI